MGACYVYYTWYLQIYRQKADTWYDKPCDVVVVAEYECLIQLAHNAWVGLPAHRAPLDACSWMFHKYRR